MAALPARRKRGRPKKSELERRTVRIHPRFTVVEAAVIETNAAAAGVSPPEYVRQTTVGAELKVTSARSADPELVRNLQRLWQETRDVGNLINQGLKYAHMDREKPPYWEALPEEVSRILSRIETQMDALVLGDDS